MSVFQRLFLTVEGEYDAYPNYRSAKIHLTTGDPATESYKNLFITSPLFCPHKDGVSEKPLMEEGTKVIFMMVPSVFPTLNELITRFTLSNELWFSIGLANLVLFDNSKDGSVTQAIVSVLLDKENITAYEVWEIDKGRISLVNPPIVKNFSADKDVYHCGLAISEKVPLHIKFACSEYIISVDKFLTASKKFTPHYFSLHEKTVLAANDLVTDLAFLYQDELQSPSDALLSSLDAETKELAVQKLHDPSLRIGVDELINDWHGKLIQFNSSMSYIYSQTYSGTFPIFDHIGLVRRHSLLGIGSGVGALYELLSQLENVFFRLPFDELTTTLYFKTNCPPEYSNLIIDPSLFEARVWYDDVVKNTVVGTEVSHLSVSFPEDFFHRLSFFSGRLGFREYELSATAAIQVLVESHRLPWHIINYTHEVIHNHVRMILNQMFVDLKSWRPEEESKYLKHFTDIIEEILDADAQKRPITYFEFFIATIIKFVINAEVFGSLIAPSDSLKIVECQGSAERKTDYMMPDSLHLQNKLLWYYKDVTEIFVHVIDFCYIYKKQEEVYMMSIWASWSTIPAVVNDIKQYILRSLVIIGLQIEGSLQKRYTLVVEQFRSILMKLKSRDNNFMYNRIFSLLNQKEHYKDLQYRFYNCMIVGDLAYHFFVGKLETLLDNNDKNTLPVGNEDEFGVPALYYIQRNSFEGESIKSKVRFLLDQLIKEAYYEHNVARSDDLIEKTSAWLLLSLSSFK
ncbi:hypothetical protein [Hufsiella ginkgonis]|uniref:Uncharacterized protein n=1 Tax=Hufsiella ginkgonis TaxID=2695274 RepID=A0A7K1Y099_9SPHI|nr:hypothetical protein [Hufsiella ginkgonis]MXV16498.1 hypothetical protein [Hufsiella ginkgonis]